MLKILVVGDPHFKTNNVNEVDVLINKCYDIIENKSPDIIVIMGDILDGHNIAKGDPYKRSSIFLYELSKKIPTYLVIGNHDRPNNRTYLTDDHFFIQFKLCAPPNLHIIDDTTLVREKDIPLVFVPYVPVGKFMEAVQKVDYMSARIIFAHQEFKGSSYNGIKSTKGDVWPSENPLIISGHIHDEQKLQPNLIYVGTPFQISFGESYDKSLSLFTITEDNVKRSRIRLDIPIKMTSRYEIKNINKELVSYHVGMNLVVKLVLSGSKAEIEKFKASRYAKKLDSWGVSIQYEQTVKVKYVASNLDYIEHFKSKLNAHQLDLLGKI